VKRKAGVTRVRSQFEFARSRPARHLTLVTGPALINVNDFQAILILDWWM
jgi:hypothetical protein